MNRSLAVFVGFLMTLPAYAYDADDYVTPASVAYVKGAYDALAGAAVTGAGTGLEKSATSPYTLGVKSGGIGATQLATNAVTTAKIKNANVTTAKIADANVTMAKLASDVKQEATDTATYSGTGLTTQGYVDEKVAAATSGLQATITAGNGLSKSGSTLSAKAYNGITVNGSGVSVTPYNGITVDGSGVSVKPYNGINVSSSGVGVKLDGTTLSVGANGLKVNTITSANIGAGEVKNGNIANSAVTLDKINSTAKKGATDTATYSGTGLTTQGYVDEKVAAAVSGLPTQDTNTTYAAGNGVTISGTNNAIAVKAYNGINVDGSGVGVKLDGTTLSVGANGLKVNAITSANIGTSAVLSAAISANAVTNAKIADSAVTLGKIDSTAKKGATDTATYSGTGLTTQGYVDEKVAAATSGLQATITAGNGLSKSGSTLSAKAYNGITVDSNGVSVKPYNGISVSSSGVGVKLDGTTLSVGANGVKVNEIGYANIASGSKQDGATTQTSKLATTGYVTDAVATAVSGLPTQDTNTTYAAGNGVTISGTNNAIAVKAYNGINVDGSGVGVKLDGTTLSVGSSGVKVNEIGYANIASGSKQDGATTQTSKLATTGYVTDAVATATSGLQATISAGNGLSKSGATLSAKAYNGITVNSSGVSVKPYNGINVSSSGVGVKLDGTTLSVGANGLKVNEIGYANIASGSKQDGATTQTSKLATTGYVTDAITSATSNMATQDGVRYTLRRAVMTVPVYSGWGQSSANLTVQDVPVKVVTPTYYTTEQ